jgi:hypothetical protein
MTPISSYRAQTWDGEVLVSEIAELSIDAAREIARSAPMTGHTGRLMAESPGVDYCEVYARDGSIRRGTFAETTIVRL